jgi:hypothetical protein
LVATPNVVTAHGQSLGGLTKRYGFFHWQVLVVGSHRPLVPAKHALPQG